MSERICRLCGCTDDDCRQCIEKTGKPCYWVEADLCSACETRVSKLHIVFDGPPGPTAGRFVEVENDKGSSINVGEWVERSDGLWELVLDLVDAKSLRKLLDDQSADAGLWFDAETCPEAYLQNALRRLHRAIECTPPLVPPAEAFHLVDQTGPGVLCGAEVTPDNPLRIAADAIQATCEECQAIALGREVRGR
jgi:hypothetical protein